MHDPQKWQLPESYSGAFLNHWRTAESVRFQTWDKEKKGEREDRSDEEV